MAATDILSITEARGYVGLAASDTQFDVDLAVYVTGVSIRLDRMDAMGPVVQRDVNAERVQTTNRAGVPLNFVRTRLYPVTSFGSIVEHTYASSETRELTVMDISAPAGDQVDAPGWVTNSAPYCGLLQRTYQGVGSRFLGDLSVTYTAGRYADTDSVPADIKRAAGFMLDNLWKSREPSIDTVGDYTVPRSRFPAFDVPNVTRMLVGPEWIGEGGTG